MNQPIQAMRLDLEKQYRKEQALMSSCVFNHGMAKLRNASNSSKGKPAPTAWLPRQRNAVSCSWCILTLKFDVVL
jgi:protein HOOK3